MGGKSKPDNSAVVQEQQQQAAQDAAKEAARQQRIQQGLTSIKQAFEGSPVMASKNTPFDWSSFNPGIPGVTASSGIPSGYKTVQIPGASSSGSAFGSLGPQVSQTRDGTPIYGANSATPTANLNSAYSGQYGSSSSGGGGGSGRDPPQMTSASVASPTASAYSAPTWGLQDASGKIYKPGDKLDITSQYDTGEKSGGFDDAFYNKYKQAVLDYYQPQVDKQYSDAKKQAVYGLGRSGNLISSAANDLNADLATQNAVNVAGVRNQADTAAGDLRSQVNTEEQKAVSQLYATEDPEVAAQQSLASVRDISNTTPQMSPLSALFNVATIGGANVLKGYQGQQNLNTFNSSLPVASRSSSIVKTG